MSALTLPAWISDTVRVLTGPDTTHEEWLRKRAGGVGASDVSAILGVNPWAGPFDVWAAKTGRASAVKESRIMRLGHVLEPAIREFYEEETGLTVYHQPNLILQHPEDDWLRYSPDGLVTDAPRLFEAKSARRRNEWASGVSAHAEAQVVAGQTVVGPEAMTADVALLLAGDVDQFVIHPVEYQQAACDYVREEVARFWHDYVLADVPPPPDFRSLDTVLDFVGPADPDTLTVVAADAEVETRALLDEYRTAREAKKDAERRMDSAKAQLLLTAGDGAEVVDEEGVTLYTYRTQSSRRITLDAIRAAGHNPDDFKTTATSRVLRVN